MDRNYFPGEGNGNPLQYPCLENPMNTGAWHGDGKESDITDRLKQQQQELFSVLVVLSCWLIWLIRIPFRFSDLNNGIFFFQWKWTFAHTLFLRTYHLRFIGSLKIISELLSPAKESLVQVVTADFIRRVVKVWEDEWVLDR